MISLWGSIVALLRLGCCLGQYDNVGNHGANNAGYGEVGSNGGGEYGSSGGGYLGAGSVGGGTFGGGVAGGGRINLPNLVYPPTPIGYQNEQGYGYGNIFLLAQLLGGYDKAQAFMGKLYSMNMPKDAGHPATDGGDYGSGSGAYGYGGHDNNGEQSGSNYDSSGEADKYARNINPGGDVSIGPSSVAGYGGPNTNFGYRQPPAVPAAPDP